MRDNIERARQFMPFAALKGYDELIRERQQLKESRRELYEDKAEMLSRRMSNVRKGMFVRICYYSGSSYASAEGTVTEFDHVFRVMAISSRTELRLSFDDIYDISWDGCEDMEDDFLW